jgi:predicted ArsR family transcriptional regulator
MMLLYHILLIKSMFCLTYLTNWIVAAIVSRMKGGHEAMTPPWNERFFATTRGQLILLLRRASRTVEELAQSLQLTDNAVRSHLATLERDGMVEQQGVRRGTGKPAFVYALTIEAERLFPKAYEPVLDQLLDVLQGQQSPAEVEDLLHAAGRRLAGTIATPDGDLGTRVRLAAETLTALGGLSDVVEAEESFQIQGQRCPLGGLVSEHPQLCQLAQALVSQIVGKPVQENCTRGHGATPHCRFAVAKIG